MSDLIPLDAALKGRGRAAPLVNLISGVSVKAVAIARGYVATSGIDLGCVPTFADISIGGERRTAIRLLIDDRGHLDGAADLLTVADPVAILDS